MRSRAFDEQELERLGPPLSPEITSLIEQYPDDVCGVLSPLMSEERKARIEEVLAHRLRSFVLVLDHLADPHNRAAILRTAEAMGVQEIHVIQRDGDWPLSRRVTQGCHKWLDLFIHTAAEECLVRLIDRGYRLMEASEEAVGGDGSSLDVDLSVALCLGNEHSGVTDEVRTRCHGRVGIPMQGFTRSLNVSVAAGLLISQLTTGRTRGLNKEDEARLRARYYVQSVRSPLEVLRRQEWR